MNNENFEKNYLKCEKTSRCQACNNQSNKKLFDARTKLLYNKVLLKFYQKQK